MSEVVFETERLTVRRWQDDDNERLLAVYGDADAMRWVGDGSPITPADCLRWIQVTYGNYRTRGYGMFAVERKTEAGAIGFCGLVHPDGQPEAEAKYAYLRSEWGRGYATEALRGLLRHAAGTLGLDHVIATTAPENIASHRVLLKAGMRRIELRTEDDGSLTQIFGWSSRPA